MGSALIVAVEVREGLGVGCHIPRYLCTLTHLHYSQRSRHSAAAQAKHLKIAKYAQLESSHLFVPITVETSGGTSTLDFVGDL